MWSLSFLGMKMKRDNARLLEVSRIAIGEDNNRHETLLLEKHPGLYVRKLSADVKGGKVEYPIAVLSSVTNFLTKEHKGNN